MRRAVIRSAVLALLVALAGLLGWGAWRTAGIGRKGDAEYREGVMLARENQHYKAMEQFARAIQYAEFDADVSIHARYNLAYLRALERSFKSLAGARGLLEDVLRQRPGDQDARRNLEIVIALMRTQMLQEGMNQESAEQALSASSDSQRNSETPGTGSEYGGGRRDEKDY